MLTEFRARRSLVVDGLRSLPGVSCLIPRGAFYAFPNVGALPISAEALSRRLLDEAGVALLAGSAFGTTGGHHLRISYANSAEKLTEALDRIATFLAQLGCPKRS
jgi:aspartate/methionine/tyrosine aminotransferase